MKSAESCCYILWPHLNDCVHNDIEWLYNNACNLGSFMVFSNMIIIRVVVEIIIIRASQDSSVLQQKHKYIIIDTVSEHLHHYREHA